MDHSWRQADELARSQDWRATYHLSPAAWLGRRVAVWPPLGRHAACLDGWRVSRNLLANNYDPRIEQTPVYRLRHVEPMALRTEPAHWHSPSLSDQPFCVQPGDVLVRRVGSVAAALVSERHRRHPVDANLGILRGLDPAAALWAAWCLNQPHYQAYLEGEQGISALVRVGLRRLAEMPLAPLPEQLGPLADAWFRAMDADTVALERLAALRAEVAAWALQRCAGISAVQRMFGRPFSARSAWFAPADLSDQLNLAISEQRAAARALLEHGVGQPLSALARINPGPADPTPPAPAHCRVLRIKDLDQQLSIQGPFPARDETLWRSQPRPLATGDVLLSTFAAETKVAWLSEPLDSISGGSRVLPSEQLVILCFHRWPGAFALLLESPPVVAQWQRLATAGSLRFVPGAQAARLVLPVPEPAQAEDWERRLFTLLEQRRSARQTLNAASDELRQLYRKCHPGDHPELVHRAKRGDDGVH